jgi:hypothetical protein
MQIPRRWGPYIRAVVKATDESPSEPIPHLAGYYEKWYHRLNYGALAVHALNFIGICFAVGVHLRNIKPGYAFVSPVVPLRWTNHALVLVDAKENKCDAVTNSPHFQATLRNERSYPPRQAFMNFMGAFDFSGTDIIEYDIGGAEININAMLSCFCVLSLGFQTAHQWLLVRNPDMPRFMHYLEYSFSSSLMAMTMAVEVGINELFAVVGIGGLFFSMNIAGMGAEIMAHYARKINDAFIGYLCILTHFMGWIMFLMAMVPIWAQFHQVLECSENGGTPGYVYALVIVESFLFFLFGFLQAIGMYEKLMCPDNFVELLFRYDCAHAMLSLLAKTILVWLLVVPGLSVDTGVLVDRGG